MARTDQKRKPQRRQLSGEQYGMIRLDTARKAIIEEEVYLGTVNSWLKEGWKLIAVTHDGGILIYHFIRKRKGKPSNAVS